MKHKSSVILFFILFISFGICDISTVRAQKSQIQIARNVLGKLQAAVASGKSKKDQLNIIGEGIKATESAEKDRRTKNWPETWSIKAYLSSYISLIDEDENNAERYFNIATEAVKTATELDKYQDNGKLIEASNFNLIIKKQEKGNKAYYSNEFINAYNLLRDVSDFFPKDTALAINTGIAAQIIRSYDNALFYLKRAKDNGAKNPVIFQSLATTYASKFEPEIAIKTLEEGIKLNPYNSFLTNDYINLLLDNEKYDKALEAIEQGLKVETKNKLLYFLYGYLQQLKSNNSTAELAYKRALGLDQNYFVALYQLGLAYVEMANESLSSKKEKYLQQFTANINRSESTLLQAHEINPNDKFTVQLLIDIYTRKNRLDKVQELKRKLQEF